MALAVIALAILLVGPAAGAHDAVVAKADPGTDSWPTYGADQARTGFDASETSIKTTNVAKLELQATYKVSRNVYAQPVSGDGLIFFGSLNGYEYAVSPAGALVWSADVGQLTLPASCDSQGPNPLGVTGTADFVSLTINGVVTPVLLVPGGNSTLYALNATDGDVIWQTPLAPDEWDYIWDSPAYLDGHVYIGVASPANCPVTVQGVIFSLDATTGQIQNSFDVVPNGCVGGGVWGSIAVDQSTGDLYVGTGSPADHSCGGKVSDEPYAPALLELSASDLSLVGYWQLPKDQQIGDSDFGSTPVLFTADDGTPMVAIANKNGVLYAFDRGDLDAGPAWQVQLSDDNHEPPLAPGAFDGHYLYEAAGPNTIDGQACKGTLYKIDPTSADTESITWAECTGGWPLGAISMVKGLIVVGIGPHVDIYATAKGKLLYHYNDHSARSRFDGAASFSDGEMFYGNQNGNFYVFGIGQA